LAIFANPAKMNPRRISMPTRNVNLTEHFDRLIEAGVTSGRFSNASEVVREGLRLLEQREQEDQAKLEWLRKAAKTGFDQIDRGSGIEFHSVDELDAFVDQIGEEVSAELADERRRG
jgi:antitoxin ParD1/3/4